MEGPSIHNAYTQIGNNNTKPLACTAIVRPILEYGAVCWDQFRQGQVSALIRGKREWLNLQII